MPAPPEDLPVTLHHDIYPGIDPTSHFKNKTYARKIVLITGSSRGIGQEIALFYARSGASLALLARDQASLDVVKELILKDEEVVKDGSVRVEVFVADVCDVKEVEGAVRGAVGKFGKLDIVVANAGKADLYDRPFTEDDPEKWWKTVEVNLRGVYNIAHYSLPYLDKTSGYFIITSSLAAQARFPFLSPYSVSKHAVGRLNEYIALEHPKVKSIAFHPGAIKTAITATNPSMAQYCIDTLQLPAAAVLRFTSGKADWLSGRYFNANWDFGEVEERFRGRIVEDGGLVSRLAVLL
ncbi:NAD-P-binding protein, partial [Sistotremastrum niveocremeum HHB9708]